MNYKAACSLILTIVLLLVGATNAYATGFGWPVASVTVNSWFDHQGPFNCGINAGPPSGGCASTDNMTRYDGQSWANSNANLYNCNSSNCYNGHNGIDFHAPQGTNVYAVDDGTVISAQFDSVGGNEVRIWHSALGYASKYSHLLTIAVGVGNVVPRGWTVGTSGCTGSGCASSAHLHFMAYDSATGGHPRDPYGWTGSGSDPYAYSNAPIWGPPTTPTPTPTATPTPTPLPTGTLGIWYMNGSYVASGTSASQVPASGWKAHGMGDFNSDGQKDIILQDQSSMTVAAWMMSGSYVASGITLTPTPVAGWSTIGVADHNQDGYNDIYFQHQPSRTIDIWFMNGTTQISDSLVSTIPASGWDMVGTGDFDYDGYPDILLQNQSSGQIGLWYMSGGTIPSGTVVSTTPASGWKVVGTGDFDGDAKDDIVLQNQSSGDIGLWMMNGTTVTSGVTASQSPGAAWKVTGVSDVNTDGWPDLSLQLQ